MVRKALFQKVYPIGFDFKDCWLCDNNNNNQSLNLRKIKLSSKNIFNWIILELQDLDSHMILALGFSECVTIRHLAEMD